MLLEKSHKYNLLHLMKCLKNNVPLVILKPFWVVYADKKYVNVSETYSIIDDLSRPRILYLCKL